MGDAEVPGVTDEASSQRLREILRLAQDRRLVRLSYKRPGEATATEYLIEPYRLHRTEGGPAVHGFQLEPPPEARAGWRDFRLDRVTSVADGGRQFEPRIPITAHLEPQPDDLPRLHTIFRAWSETPVVASSPADEYFRHVESAMLDGQVTPEELDLAEELAGRVEIAERKAVHARVFANVLREIVQDGRVAHREELYLRQVRELLDRLGWSP